MCVCVCAFVFSLQIPRCMREGWEGGREGAERRGGREGGWREEGREEGGGERVERDSGQYGRRVTPAPRNITLLIWSSSPL